MVVIEKCDHCGIESRKGKVNMTRNSIDERIYDGNYLLLCDKCLEELKAFLRTFTKYQEED